MEDLDGGLARLGENVPAGVKIYAAGKRRKGQAPGGKYFVRMVKEELQRYMKGLFLVYKGNNVSHFLQM